MLPREVLKLLKNVQHYTRLEKHALQLLEHGMYITDKCARPIISNKVMQTMCLFTKYIIGIPFFVMWDESYETYDPLVCRHFVLSICHTWRLHRLPFMFPTKSQWPLQGAAIAYAGIGLARNLSATGALVVTNIEARRIDFRIEAKIKCEELRNFTTLFKALPSICGAHQSNKSFQSHQHFGTQDKVLVLFYGIMMPAAYH